MCYVLSQFYLHKQTKLLYAITVLQCIFCSPKFILKLRAQPKCVSKKNSHTSQTKNYLDLYKQR